MSEMVERGIDALIANFKATVEANCKMFGVNQTKVQVPSRDAFRPMVVAMIDAMREPTEAMVSTAGLIDIERPGNDETNSTFNLTNEEIEFVWYAMIDTALDETPKP